MSANIGWFTSGRDIEAINLLKTIHAATQDGRIEGRISFIFINRERGEGIFSDQIIGLAKGWGVPVVTLSSAGFMSIGVSRIVLIVNDLIEAY